MSETQRRAWSKPETKIRRCLGLKQAWEGEGATERRAVASHFHVQLWRDEAFREKTIAAMRNGKRAKSKQRIIDLARAYEEMTTAEIGLLVGRTAESVIVVLRRARKMGLIGPRFGDGPRLRRKAAMKDGGAEPA